MTEEIQANTSQREISMRTKQTLKKKGAKSPDLAKMYGLKVDSKTTYFYPTPEKREKHLKSLLKENKELKYLFINPKN